MERIDERDHFGYGRRVVVDPRAVVDSGDGRGDDAGECRPCRVGEHRRPRLSGCRDSGQPRGRKTRGTRCFWSLGNRGCRRAGLPDAGLRDRRTVALGPFAAIVGAPNLAPGPRRPRAVGPESERSENMKGCSGERRIRLHVESHAHGSRPADGCQHEGPASLDRTGRAALISRSVGAPTHSSQ